MRMGTRADYCKNSDRCEDHPHAYGDKLTETTLIMIAMGSSPCVWGQGYYLLVKTHLCGIIPMRMGTSSYGKSS